MRLVVTPQYHARNSTYPTGQSLEPFDSAAPDLYLLPSTLLVLYRIRTVAAILCDEAPRLKPKKINAWVVVVTLGRGLWLIAAERPH